MYIGIDAGTSGIKAVLVDEAQAVLAKRTVGLSSRSPHPGWSEQDPADWWGALLDAVDGLRAEQPAAVAAVRGIGLSGQQHGAVLLDAAGQVLRPCILWNDVRSSAECEVFEQRFPDSRSVCGNIAMPGFTAPKLIWVARHEPEIFDAVRHVLLPKAWLRYRLSGEMIEDMSDASGTLWQDVGRRRWSDDALAATGLTRAAMPALCEGTAQAGRLTRALAARWGMAVPPILAGGAGDNAAGAVGLGAVREGDAFVSLGTSGVVWATTERFRPRPESAIHAFCHAVPEMWHQMGVTLSAASCLAWWAEVAGRDEAALLAELPERVTAPSGVLFLPYLSGERTPHNDAAIRGAFVGLDRASTRADMTQAVLEGVAFSFRDALDGLASAGSVLRQADVIGGGARSAAWVSILASVMDIPLHRLAHGEQGGAFGAARLARLAATGERIADICLPPERIATVAPDAALREAYGPVLARYRALYPALSGLSPRRGAA
ncbi:xylulokinase [Nguyenibacter vanlangensis]|uniref:Xylulose kinase n=1 Tax=Nguyenibacter vanlangensis TaxID=1216886 RepID=A0ABZ3D5J0_9PROT